MQSMITMEARVASPNPKLRSESHVVTSGGGAGHRLVQRSDQCLREGIAVELGAEHPWLDAGAFNRESPGRENSDSSFPVHFLL